MYVLNVLNVLKQRSIERLKLLKRGEVSNVFKVNREIVHHVSYV